MLEGILGVLALVVGAYLLGSIPSAVWIGRIFYGVDVREHGSGNAGTTNVLRVLGRKAAIPVFVIDALKGYGAVMLCWFSNLRPEEFSGEYSEGFVNLRIALMICAIFGHIYPVFAGFRGGKGVATIAGALIAISPMPLAGSFMLFVMGWSLTGYLSVGSILAAITYPIWIPLWQIIIGEEISITMMVFSFIVSAMLIYTHRANIKRLRSGTETKTSLKRRK